jgi:hypothetical protein
VTLVALTVISRRDPLFNSLHVVVGALVLTTSLLLTLRSWRRAFRIGDFGLRIPQIDNPQSIRNPRSAIRNGGARA